MGAVVVAVFSFAVNAFGSSKKKRALARLKRARIRQANIQLKQDKEDINEFLTVSRTRVSRQRNIAIQQIGGADVKAAASGVVIGTGSARVVKQETISRVIGNTLIELKDTKSKAKKELRNAVQRRDNVVAGAEASNQSARQNLNAQTLSVATQVVSAGVQAGIKGG